ncbi:MAG TPA: hypothetical protein VFG69_03485 [Nannocystaceae bacterium]|nr:hypothetical protein [Nannocystaceae bacterium]
MAELDPRNPPRRASTLVVVAACVGPLAAAAFALAMASGVMAEPGFATALAVTALLLLLA